MTNRCFPSRGDFSLSATVTAQTRRKPRITPSSVHFLSAYATNRSVSLRRAKTQKRLDRDGRSAAAMDEAERKDEKAQVVAGQRPADRDAKEESPEARKPRLLEAFREKSGRDRHAELDRGR
jgi:hypothetical protein